MKALAKLGENLSELAKKLSKKFKPTKKNKIKVGGGRNKSDKKIITHLMILLIIGHYILRKERIQFVNLKNG